jgi:hypothetical protein
MKKKKSLFILVLASLFFSLGEVAHGWQGRMAGMGDPFGLIQDESDFLIHPTGIAKGQGVNFYGFYRFNWRQVPDWNYTATAFNPVTGGIIETWPYRGSGHEKEHNGLLGVAFPLGPGRMGLFLEYAGKRSDFNGDEDNQGPLVGLSWYHIYKLDSDLDSFALRLLYGLPMGGFKLGVEMQLAYRREGNGTFINEDLLFGVRAFHTNFPLGGDMRWINLFPFMIPYDSKYWQALVKGSLEGAIGPTKIALTVRGGFIFSGENKYKAISTYTNSPAVDYIDLDGDVKGWKIGSDFWLRYSLAEGFSLPFNVRFDYQEKTREGNEPGNIFGFAGVADYRNNEKVLEIEMGGGIDKELVKRTRIAAGIYYNYLRNKIDFAGSGTDGIDWGIVDYSGYPKQREHRVILKLAGEKEVSPMVALRMGLKFFYGWVREDLRFDYFTTAPYINFSNASQDGHRWGIAASLGGTAKFDQFSLEPFIGGGCQKLHLSGGGFDFSYNAPIDRDKTRKEWFIGGGLSIKY